MLDALELDLAGKTVTTDALLTQRTLAHYLHRRGAHFVFSVKANHPTVLADADLACLALRSWDTEKISPNLPNVGDARRHATGLFFVVHQRSGEQTRRRWSQGA